MKITREEKLAICQWFHGYYKLKFVDGFLMAKRDPDSAWVVLYTPEQLQRHVKEIRLKATLDKTRGELDAEYGVGVGWSGPTTEAYLKGYRHKEREDHREQRRRKELVDRGWY